MSILSRPSTILSLVITIAAYASGTVLAGLTAMHAVQRVATAFFEQFAPPANAPRRQRAEQAPLRIASAAPALRREAAMTPLNDKWTGQSRPGARLAAGSQFGGSSRNAARWPGPWGFDSNDDDDRQAVGGTYRTLCVRLCDGYYFPVSFAAGPDHLERDRAACESRCGTQGRLFVHRNPGGSVEDMQDLSGRPYRQLRTAFLYRSEYVPSCACQPHPWEAASRDRHRAYALAAAARTGSRDALKELRALQAKVREAAKLPNPTAVVPGAAASAPAGKDAELAQRDAESLMRLGGNGSNVPQTRAGPGPGPGTPSSREPDWSRRAFGSAASGG